MSLASGFTGFLNYLSGKSDNQFAKDGGLTPEDKKVVQQVWGVVGTNLKSNGVAFFLTLFTKYPSYQDFFSAFRGIPTEQLKDSPKLRVHATTVMHALTAVVENLDDPECFVGLIQKTARNHKVRGLDTKHFDVVTSTLVQFLEDNLGSHWSPQARVAFEKVMKVILGIITKENESSK